MKLTLNHQELHQGAAIGVLRSIEAVQHGSRDKFPTTDAERFGRNITGALAEMAVAKLFDRYWMTHDVHHRKLGDVGKVEVRSSSGKQTPLRVYKHDPAGSIFVLVVTDVPDFEFVGWCYGAEAQQEQFWNDRLKAPCFEVPQSRLKPVEQLMQNGTSQRKVTHA